MRRSPATVDGAEGGDAERVNWTVRFDASAQFGFDSGKGRRRVGTRWNRRVHPDIVGAGADEAGAFGAAQLEPAEERSRFEFGA